MERLKNICFVIFIFAIITAVLYAMAAFSTFEANPANWSFEGRLCLAVMDIIMTLVLTGIAFGKLD